MEETEEEKLIEWAQSLFSEIRGLLSFMDDLHEDVWNFRYGAERWSEAYQEWSKRDG